MSLILACVGLMSCAEKPEGEPEADGTQTSTPDSTPADDGTPVTGAAAGGLVPLPIVLPKPQFAGTPTNLDGVENLEPPLG
ncbi:MAG: hypothetical protein GY809_15595, partial [Planctomycetes bacterium]|nr:hypothetical protein [Planctomycetota bacterium]